jgi:hypothetical protein
MCQSRWADQTTPGGRISRPVRRSSKPGEKVGLSRWANHGRQDAGATPMPLSHVRVMRFPVDVMSGDGRGRGGHFGAISLVLDAGFIADTKDNCEH